MSKHFIHKKAGYFFVLLGAALLFISLNRHAHHAIFNYHKQVYSDKAGYHVYNPALFYYQFNGKNMPSNLDSLTGYGFRINGEKISTKYPLGTALLQLPFFMIAAGVDALMPGDAPPGFSETHHIFISLATAFYTAWAFYLLLKLLTVFIGLRGRQAALLLAAFLFGTNLLYYATRDAGMSHAYSFFCFTVLIHSWIHLHQLGKSQYRNVIILVLGICLVLRPINMLFLLPALCWLQFKYPIHFIPRNNKGYFVLSLLIAALPFVLQTVYNRYAFGDMQLDSYKNETFSNWQHMDLWKLWFAPQNGLFLYAPVLFLCVVLLISRLKEQYNYFLVILFLLISLVYAAWWSPELGCGFGHRGFTEFLVFFLVGVAPYYKKIKLSVWQIISTMAVAIVLFLVQYQFDGCWHGTSPWDWNWYFNLFKI